MAVCSDRFRMLCERSPPSFLAEVGQLNHRVRISTLQHIADHEAMIPYNPHRSKPQTRAKRKRSWSLPARYYFLRRCQFPPGPNTDSYMPLCAILYQHACALIRITPLRARHRGMKGGVPHPQIPFPLLRRWQTSNRKRLLSTELPFSCDGNRMGLREKAWSRRSCWEPSFLCQPVCHRQSTQKGYAD